MRGEVRQRRSALRRRDLLGLGDLRLQVGHLGTEPIGQVGNLGQRDGERVERRAGEQVVVVVPHEDRLDDEVGDAEPPHAIATDAVTTVPSADLPLNMTLDAPFVLSNHMATSPAERTPSPGAALSFVMK
jgi:hypothetical protein